MKNIKYIASGCGFLRICTPSFIELPENIKNANDVFKKMQSEEKKQTFGLLYNAYGESNFGKPMVDFYSKSIDGIMADSGGLQVITQGEKITDDLRKKVFSNQLKYSDYAMCFDQIPVVSLGDKSIRNSEQQSRFFDRTKLKDAALQTAKDLKNQIEIFGNTPNKEIFLIIQGNDSESYKEWVETIANELTDYERKKITSIAIGAAALGQGQMEDLQKIQYFLETKHYFDVKRIHFLGVGSFARMASFVVLRRTLLADVDISFDSTTHTMAPHFGNYDLPNAQKISFNRIDGVAYDLMYNDVKRVFPDFKISRNDYFFFMNNQNQKLLSEEQRIGMNYTVLHQTMAGIINYQSAIDSVSYSDDLLEAKRLSIIANVRKLATVEDLDNYIREMQRFLKSKKISNKQEKTLGDLF